MIGFFSFNAEQKYLCFCAFRERLMNTATQLLAKRREKREAQAGSLGQRGWRQDVAFWAARFWPELWLRDVLCEFMLQRFAKNRVRACL